MKKLICIITPNYNQEKYLLDNIDSVNLVDQSLEHIIIDGNSTDESLKIIHENKHNITLWISETDSGQSEAINKGIKLAKGEIINWLNADDYFEPNALSIVAKHFEDPNVKVLMGKSRLFKNEHSLGYSRGTDVYPGNLAKTIGWARIDQPETFFRKEAWDKVGLLNEQLHYVMDKEWWMRYLYIFGLQGFKKIDDVLVNFRLHDSSKTVSQKNKFQIEHDSLFYILSTLLKNKKYPDLLSSTLTLDLSLDSEIKNWTDHEIINGSFHYYLLKRADEFYYQGDHSSCKEFLKYIDPKYLTKEDLQLFQKIKFRSKLPAALLSFFRK